MDHWSGLFRFPFKGRFLKAPNNLHRICGLRRKIDSGGGCCFEGKGNGPARGKPTPTKIEPKCFKIGAIWLLPSNFQFLRVPPGFSPTFFANSQTRPPPALFPRSVLPTFFYLRPSGISASPSIMIYRLVGSHHVLILFQIWPAISAW